MALEFSEINPGSGGSKVCVDRVTIGVDDVDVQVVKLGVAADGTVPVLVTTAAPLPVLDTNSGAIKTAVEAANTALQSGGITQTQLDAMVTALQLIDNAISGAGVNVTQLGGQAVAMDTGTRSAGTQRVTIATNDLVPVSLAEETTKVIGTVTANLSATDNAVLDDISAALTAKNGYSIFRSIDLDESEEDVKGSAGNIHGWFLFNAHTATLFVKFYNATAANTTVGTTTPILTIPVPAGAGANVEFSNGIAFGTALCVAATTGVADNDTGAPAANLLIANVFYK